MPRLNENDAEAARKIHARVRQLRSKGYTEEEALRIAQKEIKAIYSSAYSFWRSRNYKKYGK